MQELYRDGFVEESGTKGLKRAPKTQRLAPEDGGVEETDDPKGEGTNTGGWVEANSLTCLTQAMKYWGMDDEMTCTEMGKIGEGNQLSFKAECRLITWFELKISVFLSCKIQILNHVLF